MRAFILKKACAMKRLETYERFLFIGPHPDDIEIGCGATASRLAHMNKAVRFLIVLDGRYGLPNAPKGTTPEELVGIRKAEALASAKLLGVDDVVFLGLSDGGQYTQRELLEAMAKAIGDFNPQVLLAPDPLSENECHQDHLNVGNAARNLACFAPFNKIMACYGAREAQVKAIAFYYTSKTNTYVKTRGYVELQLKAIFNCHLSQFPPSCPEVKSITLYIRMRAFFFGLRGFKGQAEGFRMLDQTRMHCFSES